MKKRSQLWLTAGLCALLAAAPALAQTNSNPPGGGTGLSSANANDLATLTSGGQVQDSNTQLGGQASPTVGSLARHPGWISNRWYPVIPLPQFVSATPVANTVYCTPFRVEAASQTFRALEVLVNGNDAGKFVSLAVYLNGANNRPGVLLDYAGPLTIAGTAALGTTVHNTSDAIPMGVYWTCFTTTSAAVATFQGIPTNLIGDIMYMLGSATAGSALLGAITAVSCTAASTCGGSFAVWSGSTFTWSSLASATWADTTIVSPLLGIQGN